MDRHAIIADAQARLGEKAAHELAFWVQWRERRGSMGAPTSGFQALVEEHYGIARRLIRDKRVLDIGCGPTDSLAWMSEAAERVGLDPLASHYRALGIDESRMSYVPGGSESIPFPDGHFDLVTSFNSLDHVDDLDQTVSEIVRVTAPGGLFLLLTDVNHEATACEPIEFSWDVVDRFCPPFRLIGERRFEKIDGVHQSVREHARPYDASDGTPRYGVLSATFIRMENSTS